VVSKLTIVTKPFLFPDGLSKDHYLVMKFSGILFMDVNNCEVPKRFLPVLISENIFDLFNYVKIFPFNILYEFGFVINI